MAMSNWDCLSFDNCGKPSIGVVENEFGNKLEIYKNFIFIHSENMWKDTNEYSRNVIAKINEGNIIIAGFNIHAVRGKQNGIYLACSYGDYDNLKFFAGIGCCGYKDKVEEILKSLGREKEFYSGDWGDCSGPESLIDTAKNNEEYIHYIEDFNTGEKIIYHRDSSGKYNYDNDWVGVLQDTYEDFLNWLQTDCVFGDEYDKKFFDWLNKCKEVEPRRFNQGDAYFAINLSDLFDNIPNSPIEKADAPLINKLFK